MFFDEQKDIPNPVRFPIQIPIELPRIVFFTIDEQMGVRTNFVQEIPPDLQCLTMISVICVVVDVSIRLDILTLEF